MFKTIRDIAGKNISYLKRPMLYAVLEGVFIAAPYGVIALLLPGLFENRLRVHSFWGYFALIFLFFGLRTFFSLKSHGGGMRAGYEAGTAIRLHLGEHLRKLPMGFFSDRTTGELTDRVFHNVEMVEMMISHFFTQTVTNLTTPVLILIFLFFMDPLMAMVMLSALIMALPLLIWLLKMVDKEGEKRIRMIDAANSHILEYVQGINVFKSFNLTGLGFTRLDKALGELKNFSIRFEIKAFAASLSYSAVLEAGFVALIFAGVYQVQEGKLAAGTVLVFMIVSLQFYRPLHRFAENAALTRATFAGAKAINAVFEVDQVESPAVHRPIQAFDIHFENVCFGYKGKKVLRNISFTASEHSMTALVGPSGSGKTTLVNLIARFWDVDRGTIRIGGADVRALPTEMLLGHLSMVFQHVYLFNDTVFNNIRIGREAATPKAVVAAAKTAHCHDFIEAMPNGYDTMIGEGGATLSGGEKQRIAIAQAILKDAPIVLLDEATASLDPENDKLIQAAIDTLIRSKTVIVIAHRLHTIVAADKIVVLNNGEIMQTGTHRELITQKGLYADMWRKQQIAAGWKPVGDPQ